MDELKIKKLRPNAILPRRGSKDAAGLDLFAATTLSLVVEPGESVRIPTGLAFEVPKGNAGFIFIRSSWAFGWDTKHPPIDADYRGEVSIVLHNSRASQSGTVEPGERVAQLVILPVLILAPTFVDALSPTERGSGGFGSTGGGPAR